MMINAIKVFKKNLKVYEILISLNKVFFNKN